MTPYLLPSIPVALAALLCLLASAYYEHYHYSAKIGKMPMYKFFDYGYRMILVLYTVTIILRILEVLLPKP
jgi:hypothetical protein